MGENYPSLANFIVCLYCGPPRNFQGPLIKHADYQKLPASTQ